MIKFIHNTVEIDLTTAGLNFIQENHWFKDSLFREYSLPVQITMTEQWDAILNLKSNTAVDVQTNFEGYLYRDGQIGRATLNVDSFSNHFIKFTIHFKTFEITTWKNKLATLNLERFELPAGTDIFTHANGIITQQYPDVNYNFPSIWTDKFDTSDATWAEFKKRLNAYENGDWLRNEIVNDVIYNRNIMQPMPYLLYVLKQGFIDAGYSLQGDILSDNEISKAIITAAVEYFNTSDQEEHPVTLGWQDFDAMYQYTNTYGVVVTKAEYLSLTDITHPGRFRVVGSVRLAPSSNAPRTVEVKYGNQVLYSLTVNEGEYPPYNLQIDVTFEASTVDIANGDKVRIYVDDILTANTDTKIDININPIRYHNVSGDEASVIYLPNEINLRRTVPDMEFGELVKAVMNWKNFDIDIDDDTQMVTMNYIRTALDRDNALDLNRLSNKYPEKRYQKELSFEIKFDKGDANPDYPANKIYVDKSGMTLNTYEKKESTKQINIKLLPLPLKTEGNITTTLMTVDEESALMLAFYDGLQDDIPVTVDMPNATFPELYNESLRDWYEFRINTQTFKHKFILPVERAKELKLTRLLYMFDNYLILKKIEKQRIHPNYWQIKMECDKLL